jgi:hypothetical protein
MDDLARALASLLHSVAPAVPVALGAAIAFFGNWFLASRKDQRDANHRTADQNCAADTDREHRRRAQAEEALEALTRTLELLERADEEATSDGSGGSDDAERVLQQSREARLAVGDAVRTYMTAIELKHAGQLGDRERRLLLERGAAAVKASVGSNVSGTQMIGSMRRSAVRAMAGVLSTFLANEPIVNFDRQAIEALASRWVHDPTSLARANWD